MVGDELDRDGVEDGGDEGVERGKRDGVCGQRRQRLAARGVADDDDVGAAAAASRRLEAVLSKSGAGRRHDDHRHAPVDEGDGAVLQLAGGEALGMDVGKLLELERPFHGDG